MIAPGAPEFLNGAMREKTAKFLAVCSGTKAVGRLSGCGGLVVELMDAEIGSQKLQKGLTKRGY